MFHLSSRGRREHLYTLWESEVFFVRWQSQLCSWVVYMRNHKRSSAIQEWAICTYEDLYCILEIELGFKQKNKILWHWFLRCGTKWLCIVLKYPSVIMVVIFLFTNARLDFWDVSKVSSSSIKVHRDYTLVSSLNRPLSRIGTLTFLSIFALSRNIFWMCMVRILTLNIPTTENHSIGWEKFLIRLTGSCPAMARIYAIAQPNGVYPYISA